MQKLFIWTNFVMSELTSKLYNSYIIFHFVRRSSAIHCIPYRADHRRQEFNSRQSASGITTECSYSISVCASHAMTLNNGAVGVLRRFSRWQLASQCDIAQWIAHVTLQKDQRCRHEVKLLLECIGCLWLALKQQF